MRQPEERYSVWIDLDDVIHCTWPDGQQFRIALDDMLAVFVETNDTGPWGADVWWALEDGNAEVQVRFPQMATGESDVLERLQQLPDFEVQGMNSTENARFLCWVRPPKKAGIR